ncbi:hypothetical protein ICM05_01225 [Leucobacter sp. cx-42]|uniref:hypothetical protein n=1 Tax=unclassified Leucobacter TaxID=2621730 RepID=UPI00165E3657|nr:MULTISPECIES: hypothetical protein [unclassified Leucobacter]MBC9953270.1 hypothetical protein [Leucobacter sp. cx-42]
MTIEMGGFLISAIVAIASLLASWAAHRSAKKANDKAEAANEIAGDALEAAHRSNQIAVEANRIAEEANALIERQITVQNSESTVKWEGHWHEPGMYRLVNTGHEPAIDVTARITVDEVQGERQAKLVGIGEHIDVWLPEIRDECLREQVPPARPETGHPFAARLAAAQAVSMVQQFHFIEEHVVFSTELGKKVVYSQDHRLASIQPD